MNETLQQFLNEDRISLAKLAQREGIHPSTAWRWCLRGVRGHCLESFSVGGKRLTTIQAFERWIAITNAGIGSPAPPAAAINQRAALAAVRELERMGA